MNNIDEKLKELGYVQIIKSNMYFKYKHLKECDKTYTIAIYICVYDEKITHYSISPLSGSIDSQEHINFIQEAFNELMKDIDEVM